MHTRSILVISLLAALVLTTAGCATTRTRELTPGDRAPATQAEVKIDRDGMRKTGNAQLELEIEHLPPPTELGNELTTFVVWLSPQGTEQAQNIGQLDYDPNSREGKLDITTPYEQFTLWVTAEPAGNPLERGEVVVASGSLDLRGER